MPVLIVDPEPCIRDFAVKALSYAGFQATAVVDAREALLLATSGATIELLLAELTLPEMSGIELGRRFLSLSPSTALMFMSGYAEPNLITGPLPLLEKPFTADVLIRRVADALAKFQSPARAA